MPVPVVQEVRPRARIKAWFETLKQHQRTAACFPLEDAMTAVAKNSYVAHSSTMYKSCFVATWEHGEPVWMVLSVHRSGRPLWQKYTKIRDRLDATAKTLLVSVGDPARVTVRSCSSGYFTVSPMTALEAELFRELHAEANQ